ncbi:unnamed protein product [Caenorhabditis angaria]|uniref:Uncharacterized protein n=1 Tax=Caenorhabditis angaria TaxID=860376 RepID=A0A9P1I8F7_9PELO|nr:unnamed protein product [Caenorhabditis angaria]
MGYSSDGFPEEKNEKWSFEKVREFVRRKTRRRIDDYYDLVPKPGTQFCIHLTIRSIQTATVFGSILGPVTSLLMQKTEKNELINSMVIGGMNGALVGAALGPVLSLAMCKNMNKMKKLEKLVKNNFDSSQLWQDHIAIASAAIGYMSHGQVGLVVGLDLSLIFALVTRNW